MLRALAFAAALALVVALFLCFLPQLPSGDARSRDRRSGNEAPRREGPLVAPSIADSPDRARDASSARREAAADSTAPVPTASASPAPALRVKVVDPITRAAWPSLPIEVTELRPFRDPASPVYVDLETRSKRTDDAG